MIGRATLLLGMSLFLACDPSEGLHSGHSSPHSGQSVSDREDGHLRTRSASTPSQAQSDRDREITSHIRRRLISQHQLSIAARNVRIITTEGAVLLRGEVENAGEREQLLKIARQVPGVKSIHHELQVEP